MWNRNKLLAVIIVALFGTTLLAVQDTLLLEAEDAQLTGVSVSTATAGYSGTGYVDGFDTDGDQVTFTFTIDSGMYRVLIGYNTPYGEKGYGLAIDGVDMSSKFPGSNGEFLEKDAGKIILEEGEHVAVVSKGWGWYYLDYIRFIPASVAIPQLPPGTLTDGEALGSSQEVFDYLLSMYGRKVLSGQQTLADIAYIQSVTGRIPALGVFDLIDYSVSRQDHGATPDETTEEIIAWQQATGGLVSICWHWNAPTDLIDEPGKEWWRGFYTYATTFDLELALADTSSWRYKALLRDMDVIANELRKLYNAGIPVLWRPLHEASGGWFWWGAKGSEPFQKLWKLMYDRFTHHFGLHNLIWVSTHGDYSWYAGDDYVDIVGLDIYESPEATMSAQWDGDQVHFDGRKLLTLSETGTIPIPQNILDYGTWWSWFCIWSGTFPREVEQATMYAVYNDSLIITVDELPEWNWDIPEPLDPFEVTDPDARVEYKPEAGDVTFSGDLFVGSTLTGSYSFMDQNGDDEGTSTYQWYVASDAAGSDVLMMDGETELTYVVGEDMRERFVAFEVTPVAAAGSLETLVGEPVRSDFQQISTVGLDRIRSNVTTVYPNPVSEVLHIKYSSRVEAITLLDVTGKAILHLDMQQNHRTDLDMTPCLPGIYLLKISRKDDTSEVLKIIKKI